MTTGVFCVANGLGWASVPVDKSLADTVGPIEAVGPVKTDAHANARI
jgi:hypothetical protein